MIVKNFNHRDTELTEKIFYIHKQINLCALCVSVVDFILEVNRNVVVK